MDTQENERDRSTLIIGNSSRVHCFRVVDPGKIRMPTNQIRAMSTQARVPREVRARALQPSGVYKESRVAYRAIRVRVS